MAYYEDRRHYPRDRRRASSYAADYYDNHPANHSRYERDVYPRASNDSVEEIQRDYPPGSDYAYERGFNSRRSQRPVYENMRRSSSVSGYDPYYSRPRRSKNYDDRRPRRSRYDSASSSSPSPQRHRRRKSLGETALGAIGLGGAAASSSRHSDRDRDRDRDRHRRGRGRSKSRHGGRSSYSSSRSPSRSRSRDRGSRSGRHRQRSEQRMAQAARAALTAGAIEAFRSRKEPGPWTGEKGKRILTAAVTAAGTDGLVDKDPQKHGTRHIIESTLAGLATNHFINDGRSPSRGRGGHSRSRSSGGGLKDLAATGALAAAGKEIYDRVSRSRSRHRGRGSEDSDDDRRGPKKRSKSVSDYVSKGMAALGIGKEGKEQSRDRDDRDYDRHRERRHRREPRHDEYSDSDADSDYHSRDSRDSRDNGRGRRSRDVGLYRSTNERNSTPQAPTSAPRGTNRTRAQSADYGCDCSSESDSDLGDSSEETKQAKKIKRDMLLTSGLATVATIHAAHGVYNGMQKRKKRMKELEEGKITAEEARKRRTKANTMDALSVGLAALGIKGAYGEWKEVNEKRKERSHFKHECAERATKRQMRRSHSQGDRSSRTRSPDEIEYPDSSSHNGFSYHDANPYGTSTDAPPQIAY